MKRTEKNDRVTQLDEDRDFTKELMDFTGPFDLGWIASYLEQHYSPNDIFSDDDLDAWALKNGYIKER